MGRKTPTPSGPSIRGKDNRKFYEAAIVGENKMKGLRVQDGFGQFNLVSDADASLSLSISLSSTIAAS